MVTITGKKAIIIEDFKLIAEVWMTTLAQEGIETLKIYDNADNVAVVADIYPTDYGTLVVRLTKGPENVHWAGFFGVNLMVIYPEGYPIPYL